MPGNLDLSHAKRSVLTEAVEFGEGEQIRDRDHRARIVNSFDVSHARRMEPRCKSSRVTLSFQRSKLVRVVVRFLARGLVYPNACAINLSPHSFSEVTRPRSFV